MRRRHLMRLSAYLHPGLAASVQVSRRSVLRRLRRLEAGQLRGRLPKVAKASSASGENDRAYGQPGDEHRDQGDQHRALVSLVHQARIGSYCICSEVAHSLHLSGHSTTYSVAERCEEPHRARAASPVRKKRSGMREAVGRSRPRRSDWQKIAPPSPSSDTSRPVLPNGRRGVGKVRRDRRRAIPVVASGTPSRKPMLTGLGDN